MALRLLLRRVANPLLLKPSGPRMGAGVSPAVARSRFMQTGSQGAEQESISIDGTSEAEAYAEYRKVFDKNMEEARLAMAKTQRAMDFFYKVQRVSACVLAPVPLLMIIGIFYQAQ